MNLLAASSRATALSCHQDETVALGYAIETPGPTLLSRRHALEGDDAFGTG
ncbi:hypothetical protein [Bosea caraganae]|uniref:hypothetical protein n=1 Tax=Bosea caraganae TaxID=2763117 RepID=UPI0015F072E1|nr:hypothetical protein [Bosea caraganae]